MQKNSASQSGLFNPRALLALCSLLAGTATARAISPSLGLINSVLLAIAIVGLPSQASAGGAWCLAPYVQVAGQGSG